MKEAVVAPNSIHLSYILSVGRILRERALNTLEAFRGVVLNLHHWACTGYDLVGGKMSGAVGFLQCRVGEATVGSPVASSVTGRRGWIDQRTQKKGVRYVTFKILTESQINRTGWQIESPDRGGTTSRIRRME